MHPLAYLFVLYLCICWLVYVLIHVLVSLPKRTMVPTLRLVACSTCCSCSGCPHAAAGAQRRWCPRPAGHTREPESYEPVELRHSNKDYWGLLQGYEGLLSLTTVMLGLPLAIFRIVCTKKWPGRTRLSQNSMTHQGTDTKLRPPHTTPTEC